MSHIDPNEMQMVIDFCVVGGVVFGTGLWWFFNLGVKNDRKNR